MGNGELGRICFRYFLFFLMPPLVAQAPSNDPQLRRALNYKVIAHVPGLASSPSS